MKPDDNPPVENNQAVPDFSDEEMKLPNSQATQPAAQSSFLGPVLVVLIVILILILGGMYIWGTALTSTPEPIPVVTPAERPTPAENNEPESTNAEAEVETLQVVSTSDEIQAIEADLESTDLDDLDAEINAIDAEFATEAQAI